MNLSQARWILLGSSAVVLPLSFFGGIAIKEYLQAEDLRAAVKAATPNAMDVDDERAKEEAKRRAAALRLERSAQARIAALEEERKGLLVDQANVENKLSEIRERIRKKAEDQGKAVLPDVVKAPEPTVMEALGGRK